MKRRLKALRVLGSALGSTCWAILLVRAWIRESSHRTYFMTPLWAIAFLLSLFIFVFWVRQKE